MRGIDIQIDGQPLDLPSDLNFTFEDQSTIFDDDVIPGSYSYPFDLPATARNTLILGSPQVLNNVSDLKKNYPCKVYISGILKLSGLLVLRISNEKKFTVNIQSGAGSLLNLKDKSIKTLDLGVITIALTERVRKRFKLPLATTNLIKSGANYNLTIRFIRGPSFTVTKLLTEQIFEFNPHISPIDKFYGYCENYINENPYDTTLPPPTRFFPGDGFSFSAYSYAESLLCSSLWVNNYAFFQPDSGYYNGDPTSIWWWELTDYDHLDTVNADVIFPAGRDVTKYMKETSLSVNGEKRICFPPILNPDFYGDSNTDFCRYLNWYDSEKQMYPSNEDPHFGKYAVSAQVNMLYVFSKIWEAAGYRVEGDFMEHPVIKTEFIYCNYSLDKVVAYLAYITPGPIEPIRDPSNPMLFIPGPPDANDHNAVVNIFDNVIDIAARLPDITVGDFLKEIKKKYALCWSIDTAKNVLTITSFSVLKNDIGYIDLTQKAVPFPDVIANDYAGTDSGSTGGLNLSYDFGEDKYPDGKIRDLSNYRIIEPVENLEDLIFPADEEVYDIRFIRNINAYYQFVPLDDRFANFALHWRYFCDGLTGYIDGAGGNEQICALAPMFPYFGRDVGRRFSSSDGFVNTIEIENHNVKTLDKFIFISSKPQDPNYSTGIENDDADVYSAVNVTKDTFQIGFIPIGRTQLSWDAHLNPNWPAAVQYDTISITVAGKLGGGAGIVVNVGDFFACTVVHTPGGSQAAVGADWQKVDTSGYAILTFDPPVQVQIALLNQDRNWVVPIVQMKGSSTEFNIGINKSGLHTAYYWGMQLDSKGNLYPLASSYNYTITGSKLGDQNSNIIGQNGIIENWWRSKIDFLKISKSVQGSIRFTAADHANLEFGKKRRIDNVMLFITNVKTTFTMQGIKASLVNFFKA